MAERRGPAATYRLQLTPDFGFADAAALAEYLADLGVTHVYLSPVLEAAPGSMHGYDVVDHSRIREALGGEAAFRDMAARFRAHGLGIVLDIVPNHMAIPVPESLNRQLWSVLREGQGSEYARWFDIDWAGGDGRMLLPILGGPVSESMCDLTVGEAGGEPVLRYFDHVLPARAGTEKLPLPELLDAQHYRLAFWRDTATKLNWRRFFDITTLIGIRVEDPAVFEATHAVLLRLLAEGLVDGLRVDHPDGLADPRGYLRQLAEATGGAWVVAEKILAPDERLPGDWPCAGTTGYDALRVVDGLFVDPDAGGALTGEYARFAGAAGPGGVSEDFASVGLAAKREIASTVLAAEVTRLARLFAAVRPEPAGDAALDDIKTGLAEVLAAFEVYRAYVRRPEPSSPAAVTAVRSAVAAALTRLPEHLHPIAIAAGDLALGEEAAAGQAARAAGAAAAGAGAGAAKAAEFTVRFGQTTGPVLAKGIEDTASYRWPRLTALNEVGGDPDRFGVPGPEFHAFATHLATEWPATMTTLSTHDTKRQEDVRARLAVLAELPAEWSRRAAEWHARVTGIAPSAGAVDPATEYLLWQALVGTWPIDGERLSGYLTKAMREAKTHTSWTDQNAEYEDAVRQLAAAALADPVLRTSIEEFVSSISADATVNSLGAKLVQLTMPGVPDVYQGCELTGLSLVDPDNRRPVDFGRRRELLAALDAGHTHAGGLDAAKLLITARTLRLRREHPDWFVGGGYEPLTATGPAADHVVAFVRGGRAVTVATRLPRSLRRLGGWADTTLTLPSPAAWRDVLSGVTHAGNPVPLAELTKRSPIALLVPEARFIPEEQ
ncbi:MAG TPA: malto-oligosyltrehalose synthase [Trebonia sp.]|nr:malto-oligosyltrehalose synthase [Trebonia sp.]